MCADTRCCVPMRTYCNGNSHSKIHVFGVLACCKNSDGNVNETFNVDFNTRGRYCLSERKYFPINLVVPAAVVTRKPKWSGQPGGALKRHRSQPQRFRVQQPRRHQLLKSCRARHPHLSALGATTPDLELQAPPLLARLDADHPAYPSNLFNHPLHRLRTPPVLPQSLPRHLRTMRCQ